MFDYQRSMIINIVAAHTEITFKQTSYCLMQIICDKKEYFAKSEWKCCSHVKFLNAWIRFWPQKKNHRTRIKVTAP